MPPRHRSAQSRKRRHIARLPPDPKGFERDGCDIRNTSLRQAEAAEAEAEELPLVLPPPPPPPITRSNVEAEEALPPPPPAEEEAAAAAAARAPLHPPPPSTPYSAISITDSIAQTITCRSSSNKARVVAANCDKITSDRACSEARSRCFASRISSSTASASLSAPPDPLKGMPRRLCALTPSLLSSVAAK